MGILKTKKDEEVSDATSYEYTYEYSDEEDEIYEPLENEIIDVPEVNQPKPKKQQSNLRLQTLQKARDAKAIIVNNRKQIKAEEAEQKTIEKNRLREIQTAKYNATLQTKIKKQVKLDLSNRQEELYDLEISRQISDLPEFTYTKQYQQQYEQQQYEQPPQQYERPILSQRDFLRSLGA
jgi:hypothetical protein